MVDVNNVADGLIPDNVKVGDVLQLEQDLRLQFDVLKNEDDGSLWMPLYTDYSEIMEDKTTNITINAPIRVILENAYNSERLSGLVINPFGEMIKLPKDALKIAIDYLKNKEG